MLGTVGGSGGGMASEETIPAWKNSSEYRTGAERKAGELLQQLADKTEKGGDRRSNSFNDSSLESLKDGSEYRTVLTENEIAAGVLPQIPAWDLRYPSTEPCLPKTRSPRQLPTGGRLSPRCPTIFSRITLPPCSSWNGHRMTGATSTWLYSSLEYSQNPNTAPYLPKTRSPRQLPTDGRLSPPAGCESQICLLGRFMLNLLQQTTDNLVAPRAPQPGPTPVLWALFCYPH